MIAKTMIGKTATLFFSLCITFLNTSVAQVGIVPHPFQPG
jgi:hypothetical protein